MCVTPWRKALHLAIILYIGIKLSHGGTQVITHIAPILLHIFKHAALQICRIRLVVAKDITQCAYAPQQRSLFIVKHIILITLHSCFYIANYCCPMKRPNAHLMLLPLQGATAPTRGTPGCRYACPGLGAPLGLQPALANTTCCSTVDNEVVFWPCNSLSITDIEMATMILERAG